MARSIFPISQPLLQPRQASLFVGECTIELCFERGIEQRLEVGAWFQAKLQQVPAENDWFRRAVGDGQVVRLGDEFIDPGVDLR